MNRRTFLQLSSSAAVAAQLKALADVPMPMATLGKSGLPVSRLALGGYHMRVNGEAAAIKIIHRAIDLGVNMLDSARLYHKGESDVTYGKALKGGLRQKVLLMSKAEIRDRAGVTRQLEDSLRDMQTDYLDLWQCHQVVTQKEVDEILAPGGALEAFVAAKKAGKVRHIGFTGHRDPAVLQRLLDACSDWETVQHPVNLIDPHYLSFIETVMPNIRKKGLGLLAMKSNAMGGIGKARVATIPECLNFTWSQDIDTLVSGVETLEQLEQNVLLCKTFKPLSKPQQQTLLTRTKGTEHGSKVEKYKLPEKGAMRPLHHDGERA